jgi:hypothetical protein
MPAMGKPTDFLEGDDDFFTEDGESGSGEQDHKVKEAKRVHHSRAARQRLDSRSEELWLKRQLSDWDETFDEEARVD